MSSSKRPLPPTTSQAPVAANNGDDSGIQPVPATGCKKTHPYKDTRPRGMSLGEYRFFWDPKRILVPERKDVELDDVITDDVFDRAILLIKENTVMEALHMHTCYFDRDRLQELCKVISEATTLRSVRLRGRFSNTNAYEVYEACLRGGVPKMRITNVFGRLERYKSSSDAFVQRYNDFKRMIQLPDSNDSPHKKRKVTSGQ